MTKQDIIEYVMNTPGNTNKAVLSSMLDQLINNGGNNDDENSWTILLEQTVETIEVPDANFSASNLSYSTFIDAPIIRVTFDDSVYECEYINPGFYGGFSSELEPDFSTYPFAIAQLLDNDVVLIQLATENTGTHTIKIEVPQNEAEEPSPEPGR